jgi:hypothetical protein
MRFEKVVNQFQPPQGYKIDQFHEGFQYRVHLCEQVEVKVSNQHLQHKKKAGLLLPRMDI